MVSTNAVGQAMRKTFGQWFSQAAVGPSSITDMMPDMASAIMNVMTICEINANFLSIVSRFSRCGAMDRQIPKMTAAPSISMGGAVGSHLSHDFIPQRGGRNNHTSQNLFGRRTMKGFATQIKAAAQVTKA